MEQGYVQVYTGNGKGKTTAALGLAIRAAGAGYQVFIGQFAKGQDYAELHAFKRFSDQVCIRQYGQAGFIVQSAQAADVAMAQDGLAEVKEAVFSGRYKVVILDEANIATHFGLFDVDDLLELIDNRPEHVELVLTGRCVHPRIVEKADLVTEMREVKHYYQRGVMARIGIEK